jgi:hypothetical protein
MRTRVCRLAAVALLAGCAGPAVAPAHVASSGPASRGPAPRGTVTGRLQREGGPLGPGGTQPRVIPLPGTVRFELSGRARPPVTVAVGRSGTFSVRLAPGAYRVTGQSPRLQEQLSDGTTTDAPCAQPAAVTVIAGRTVRVTLNCIVP